MTRARSRTGELDMATWNVLFLSLTRSRGAGHAEVLLLECQGLGCDVIGLQEPRIPGLTPPRQANACSIAVKAWAVVRLDHMGWG